MLILADSVDSRVQLTIVGLLRVIWGFLFWVVGLGFFWGGESGDKQNISENECWNIDLALDY